MQREAIVTMATAHAQKLADEQQKGYDKALDNLKKLKALMSDGVVWTLGEREAEREQAPVLVGILQFQGQFLQFLRRFETWREHIWCRIS